MSKDSPSPMPKSIQPRPVSSGPVRACPRWDPPNGTGMTPGITLSGLTFGTNRDIPHEVVLLDASGNPVAGAVITPSPITPIGGPPTYTGTVSVFVPAGTPAGDYYLQVRIPSPDTASNYSHTIELQVSATMPPTPEVTIVPAPGSEPGTYPVGTWIILGSTVTGGIPGYTYNWLLNGMPNMGSMPDFSFQTIDGPLSVTLQVTDSTGATGTSASLIYTGVPAGTFRVTNFRRVPATTAILVGTTVEFFATLSDGRPPYSCEVLADGATLLPTVTTSSTSEVSLGTFTFSIPGTFTSTLMARDSAGAADSPSLPVEVT